MINIHYLTKAKQEKKTSMHSNKQRDREKDRNKEILPPENNLSNTNYTVHIF